MSKNKEKLHQVACLRLFELSNPGAVADNVGNHPNAFLNSSVAHAKENKKKEANGGAEKPAQSAEPAKAEAAK